MKNKIEISEELRKPYVRFFKEDKTLKESREANQIYELVLTLLDHPRYNMIMVSKEIANAISLALDKSSFINKDDGSGVSNRQRFKNQFLPFIERL